MIIGIDGTPLTIPYPCGLKRYASNLLDNLAKIDKKNDYVVFTTKKVEIPKNNNFRLKVLPQIPKPFRKQFLLPYYIKKEKVDIFHNLQPYGSMFIRGPKIVTTVHDLELGYTFPFISKRLLMRVYSEVTKKFIIQQSDFVIAVSKTTQEELKKTYAQVKTRVIYEAADDIFCVSKKQNDNEYFMVFVDFTPRKNTENVLKAYSLLPQTIRKKNKLFLILSSAPLKRNVQKTINKYKINLNTNILIDVSESNLVKIYNNALCLVYPSLYEGFGLPILEAMACGCPVITSDYGAMKEIASDSALLVNPKNTNSIKRAMISVSTSKINRKTLVKKGLEKAKQFSWKKMAEKTLKIYQDLA